MSLYIIKEETFIINYDFYNQYLENNHFQEIFEKRFEYIKSKYNHNETNTKDKIIQDYFVEIFSWSVIPKDLLLHLSNFLKNYDIKCILDPCCGNGFHSFLFEKFGDIYSLSADIQKESMAWSPIVEKDGLVFLDDFNEKEHFEGALLLSWINGDVLALDLLNKYKGNIVISIGNYECLTTKYLFQLRNNYICQKRYILEMPWNLTEKIEIYHRK